MFKERELLIVTKHGKEKVIAPVLEKEIGVRCIVSSHFDTDTLGTFSGEIERKNDPITTARLKCLLAMDMVNCDLALASEGSFGAHPSIPFVAADDEFLLFIDKKNQLEVVVRELSLETNFSSAEIDTEKELFEFAAHAHFPSHGLILKNGKDFFSDSVKGITRTEHLRRVFKDFALRYGKVFVETDMRALYNPSRMKVIQKAAKKMAQKLKSGCPQCHTPGFGIVDIKRGLPCSSCQWPTQSTLSHVYICQSCSYAQEKKFPNGKCYEDPMYCDVCNP